MSKLTLQSLLVTKQDRTLETPLTAFVAVLNKAGTMKWAATAILALTFVFLVEQKNRARAETASVDTESVIVYPSIAVTVNKSVILHLPKRAVRVAVTQPQIAEALILAPDTILINGKSVGATSLVVWTAESMARTPIPTYKSEFK